jgi:hypothetical protein
VVRRWVPAVWLVACTPHFDLPDAPIVGASPALRAQLRAELAAFDAAIGPGRIVLREVRVVDQIGGDDDIAGGYRNERVHLRIDDPMPTFTLRHELCHAVHVQEDLLRDAHPLFDLAAAGLFTGDDTYVAALGGHYRSARRQRTEAMASFCELGPTALDALLTPCPGEAPLAADLAAWMFDHVYTAFEPGPPPEPGPVVTLDGWLPSTFEQVSGSTVPGVVVVATVDGRSSPWDLATGARRDALEAEPIESAFSPPPLRGILRVEEVGWLEGPAAARGPMFLHHLGNSASRLFVGTAPEPTCPDGCWAPVEGSCDGDEQLFTADGAVYRAWTEGLAVRWQAL